MSPEMTVTRVLDAPRQRVWEAWTDPEQFAAWFGTPPFTTPASTVSLDVRPGGRWKATMVHETEGTELPFGGEYVEVKEPERLVLTFEDPSDTSNPFVETLTITFADADGKTELVANQSGHMPEEEYSALVTGYGGFFDQLEKNLAQG